MHASSRSVSPENASHRVPVQVFEGHENLVRCVSFYPDENKLVSGSEDGMLRIWNRRTGAVEVLSGHTDKVLAVDVSQDGKIIISGSKDETARIWNGETGEMMHVFEAHTDDVNWVEFSRDSTKVVSGSDDETVRVWSVATGELAFEPIECHGRVHSARYSPSEDRIASGAEDSVQIWNAETGSGILSIRHALHILRSLEWTVDGTYVAGASGGHVIIWNSHNGEQLRTWKAHDDNWTKLSLSPTGTQLATSAWFESTALVFDVATGGQVAALPHHNNVPTIAYSPSGRFIAIGSKDHKVYVWEAPVFEDPQTKVQKSRPPSFSRFLDRPAVPLAGLSRNDGSGLDGFWDSLPNRDQQASPPPRRVFNRVRNTFENVFSRRSAGATQASPVREIAEPVEVAAGRDKVFWIVLERIVWTPLNTLIFMVFYCRKPGPEERRGFAPINRDTRANSSQAAASNAATANQSERPKTVHDAGNVGAAVGPDSSTTPAGSSVIRAQPERTASMSLSGAESRSALRDPSQTPAVIHNQRESIEMVPMLQNPTLPANAPPQPTSSTDPLSPAIVSPKSLPSSATMMSELLSVLSNDTCPISTQPPPNNANEPDPIAVTVSLEELAILQELRRRKATSTLVGTVAEPLGGPQRDHESNVHHDGPSITLAIPRNLTVPAHILPQPTPLTDALPLAVTPSEASSPSTAAVTSAPLFVSSDSAHPPSTQPQSQHRELQSGNTLSPEELATMQDLRRRKVLDSIV